MPGSDTKFSSSHHFHQRCHSGVKVKLGPSLKVSSHFSEVLNSFMGCKLCHCHSPSSQVTWTKNVVVHSQFFSIFHSLDYVCLSIPQ